MEETKFLDQRVQNITETISKLLQRLDNIVHETRDTMDYQAGYERLLHWRDRVVRYLRENVSSIEAEKLSQKGEKQPVRNFILFNQDANVFRAILVAISEALEDEPSYVLEDTSTFIKTHLELNPSKSFKYKYDVFISYSSLDQEQANIIYDAVSDIDRQAFLSAKSLSPGQDFAEEIRKQLIESQELWILVSPNSLKSEWVLTEWGAAWVLQKRIVPILHRCRPEEIPERLRRLQCIDFYKIPELVSSSFKSA